MVWLSKYLPSEVTKMRQLGAYESRKIDAKLSDKLGLAKNEDERYSAVVDCYLEKVGLCSGVELEKLKAMTSKELDEVEGEYEKVNRLTRDEFENLSGQPTEKNV